MYAGTKTYRRRRMKRRWKQGKRMTYRVTRRAMLCGAAGLGLATPAIRRARAADTLRLGMTTALTGPFNEFGEGNHRGAVLAIEAANAAGGVLGRQVELGMLLDDQLVPDRAVQNMRRILDDATIAAVYGPSGSGPTLAVIDMVQTDGRPFVNTQAQTPGIVYPNGTDKPPRPNVFSVATQNDVEMGELGAAVSAKYDVIAIMTESTGYGVTGTALLKQVIAKAKPDAKITAESYNQRAQDVTAQLARIRNAGAQAMVVVGLGADLALIRKNMARMNLNLQIYGTAGSMSLPYEEGAGKLVVGTRSTQLRSMREQPLRPAVATFEALYKAKYGTDRWWGEDAEQPLISLGDLVGPGYDATLVMLDAFKRANSTDPKQVIAAMNATKDLPGVRAVYSFTPERHNAVLAADLGIFEYVDQDGKIARKLLG